MEKITFTPDGADGEAVDFYVLEQTRIGGINYILVTEEEEGDGEAECRCVQVHRKLGAGEGCTRRQLAQTGQSVIL